MAEDYYFKKIVLNSMTDYKTFYKNANKDGEPGISQEEFIKSFIPRVQPLDSGVNIVFSEEQIPELLEIYNEINSDRNNNVTQKELYQGLLSFKGMDGANYFFKQSWDEPVGPSISDIHKIHRKQDLFPNETTIGSKKTGILNIFTGIYSPYGKVYNAGDYITSRNDSGKFVNIDFNKKEKSITINPVHEPYTLYTKNPPQTLTIKQDYRVNARIVNNVKDFSLKLEDCNYFEADIFAAEDASVEIKGGNDNNINFRAADLSVNPSQEKKYTINIENSGNEHSNYNTAWNQGADNITYTQNPIEVSRGINRLLDEKGEFCSNKKVENENFDTITIGPGDTLKLPNESYAFFIDNRGGRIINGEDQEVTLSLPESKIKGLGYFKRNYYPLNEIFSLPRAKYLVFNNEIIDMETKTTVAYINDKTEKSPTKTGTTNNIPKISSPDELRAKYAEWLENFKTKKDLYETDALAYNPRILFVADETIKADIFNLMKNDYPEYCKLLNDRGYRTEKYLSDYNKQFSVEGGADANYVTSAKGEQDREDFLNNPENMKKIKLYEYFGQRHLGNKENLSTDTYKTIYEQFVNEGVPTLDFETFVAYNLYMNEEANVTQSLDKLPKNAFDDSGYQYLPEIKPVFIPKLKK